MISWPSLLFSVFWIVGLAILLAALSYHHWLAGHNNVAFRQQLEHPSFSRAFWPAIGLIAVGLAGSSRTWWETAVWIIFALIALVNAVLAYRKP